MRGKRAVIEIEMEGSISPIVRKVAAQIASKPKRSFTPPTQVCLEDWWLSKPSDGDGIAVSGRPIEIRNVDDARRSFDITSPTRKLASREFHSTKIVKRLGGTLVETSSGFLISLCGLINKSRTQQNGFSSEICRNFICGFPFNWDDFTAQCVDVELESNENILDSFTPAALDRFSGAELHDLVLSLSDKEMTLFLEKNSMPILKPRPEHGAEAQCPVCLEDWWLSKPSDGDGIAVSGRPIEIRNVDDALRSFDITSPTRKLASREFHSTKIVKRLGGTLVETSSGFLISLCGLINKSRTQQNGFSSEICRNFICGFPFNWDDFTAQCVDVELESNENILDSFTPAALDRFNGAELHDLVLSLSDKEMSIFLEKNSMPILKPQPEHGAEAQCPVSTPTSRDSKDRLDESSAKVSMKQIMKMEKCSIISPASSLRNTHILTSDNKTMRASQNRKRNVSTHVSYAEPSISSPIVAGQCSNNEGGVRMTSKKQRRGTTLDVSFEKNLRSRSRCNTSK